ncbi:hypothetical protein PAXRUDRAFT_124754, partial [Paxillus rubicundulus Ve08.2h10]
GRHAKYASVWRVIATMLANLEFFLAKDAEGKDTMPKPKYILYMHSSFSHPETFPCRISPQ